ncbi:L-aspartate oxidase [Priestia megaterium]|nr:L-aspartate oxidase [Priestia megaterium]
MYRTDVLIIGSGLAAFAAANALCRYQTVTMVTKEKVTLNNSVLAQGGIAAAISRDDRWMDHVYDTLLAGNSHCEPEMARILAKEGVELIKELISNGMMFDKSQNGELDFGKEGAHRTSRILHAGGDATGKALFSFLQKRVLPNIRLFEHETVQQLICNDEGCIGALSQNSQGKIRTFLASHVIIATGGTGGLYACTSNQRFSTGDGLALAYRIGAKLVDLEFVQFHPTLLRHEQKAVGLVSEAVRGEGGVLVNEHGDLIMKHIHPFEDLSPRDVVSRAVFKRMKQGEDIFLDISAIKDFNERFPTVTALCKKHGIDLQSNRIPITPGSHFLMGGILVNEYGETNIPHMYAVGEVACTGVHGANRLASNSLLECLVFGQRAGKHILAKEKRVVKNRVIPYQYQQVRKTLLSRSLIQEKMMKQVGIVRDAKGLSQLVQEFTETLQPISIEHHHIYPNEQWTTINMLTLGRLMALSALEREESRGAHFRSDFPESDANWERKRIMHISSQPINEVMT